MTYLFVGYPRAITALQGLARSSGGRDDLRFLRDMAPRASWPGRGRRLCRKIYGPDYGPLLAVMRRTHPDLADWMLEEGYGKVLARPFLGARVRELVVVALLVAQESWPQLASHLAGARRTGARGSEIREALETGLRMAPRAERRRARPALRRALLARL